MQRILLASKSGGRAHRIICSEILPRHFSSARTAPLSYGATSFLERADINPSYPNCATTPFASKYNNSSQRNFWSFNDSIVDSAVTEKTSPSSSLPVSPITPSNLSATSLIAPSTIESLKSLPECQSVLDLLNGTHGNNAASGSNEGCIIEIEPAQVKEAHSNLQRAREILQSLPELQGATHLLEVDLHSLCGEFELALEGLARYEHLRSSQHNASSSATRENETTQIQLAKAKLLIHSGQFTHALSEYEDLLENMEKGVELQVKQQQETQSNEGECLPVIHGAAAMTGVGMTKLLLHLRDSDGSTSHELNAGNSDILESLETATEVLLESRKDALRSPKYAGLAVDLGLAAAISQSNLGIAHCLLSNGNSTKLAIKNWKRGIKTLDKILGDAIYSATIIPKHKFQCMESVRARLYCNISWALLGFGSCVPTVEGAGALDKVSDETLKHASDAAKKALDIYDELMNGSKLMRGGGIENDDSDKDGESGESIQEDVTRRQELEQILKERATEQQQEDYEEVKPDELPISSLWAAYHTSESARALGLVAQCYASAGAAVTAEGLFQSALDASSSYPYGQSVKVRTGSSTAGSITAKGVSSSSPNLGLIARDVRLWYASLLDNWEKRQGDADRLRLEARKIEDEGVLNGYARDDEDGKRKSVSGLESSLWLFSPLDFKR